MAPSSRTTRSTETLPAASSSEEDTSDDDEVEAQRPTKKPPPPVLAHQENGGSDDEDEGESSEELGEHGVPIKNLLLPPPQRREGSDDGEDEVGKSESESDGMPPEPTPQPKENVPSAELTKSLQRKRKARPVELAELPEAAAPAEAEEDHGKAENNAEKQFEGKITSYWYLGKEVMTLEAERPGMFKRPFLKVADAKARALDTKIKKQRMAEIKVHMRRGDIDKEVKKTCLSDIGQSDEDIPTTTLSSNSSSVYEDVHEVSKGPMTKARAKLFN